MKRFKPEELKFRAFYRGKEINNGDYWHPYHKKPSDKNCYAVKISSAGIHYCGRLKGIEEVVVRMNNKEVYFYQEFETEYVWIEDVELEIMEKEK